ncbi:MAG: hypothetical protein HGA67_00925 [Candidatus Yonathbacteria bacterium]|nr:hypothetical protein [Candidatus Yonathbacteria bacterium]
MNECVESLLGIILAPVNAACIVISATAKLPVTLFIARDYNHDEALRIHGRRRGMDLPSIWNYAFYMAEQANSTGVRIRHVYFDVTLYANPSDDTAREVNRIVKEFYANLKKRDAMIRRQNSIAGYFFPRRKYAATNIFRVVRQYERFVGHPVSGHGYP